MKVLARFLVAVLVLTMVPAAFAGASMETDKTQFNMGAPSIINDSQRSARDFKPQTNLGGVYDPNRTFAGKNAPENAQQMQRLYKGLHDLITSLKETDPNKRTAAWNGASAESKLALASLGINSTNWQGAIKSVVVLPRRVDNIKAIDHSRGGETSLVYETQMRPYTESYTEQRPIMGPIGCGCQGSQVVGYENVTLSRVVNRPTTVAVASKTPVVTTSEILTPYDGSKTVYVPRQETQTYTERRAIMGPIGCGCQGSQVVGYENVSLSRVVTVMDPTTVGITAFEHHLPQKYSGKGNATHNTKDNAFLAEGAYTEVGNNMVTRPTNDAGAITTPSMSASQKAAEMANRAGNDDKAGEVINPNGTTAKGH